MTLVPYCPPLQLRRLAMLIISGFALALQLPADAQVQARRANDFVNSIGVCTHWDYTDTPYFYAYDTVFARLKSVGDHSTCATGSTIASATSPPSGIGSTFMATIPRNTDGNDATVAALLARLKAQLAAGYRIDAIEGPNEPDLFWKADRFKISYKGQGWQQGNDGIVKGTIAMMKDIDRAFKAASAHADEYQPASQHQARDAVQLWVRLQLRAHATDH